MASETSGLTLNRLSALFQPYSFVWEDSHRLPGAWYRTLKPYDEVQLLEHLAWMKTSERLIDGAIVNKETGRGYGRQNPCTGSRYCYQTGSSSRTRRQAIPLNS